MFASVAVHAAIAAALAGVAIGRDSAAADLDRPVTLGTDNEVPESIAWIAFTDPSAHDAPEMETLQPDLSLAQAAAAGASGSTAPSEASAADSGGQQTPTAGEQFAEAPRSPSPGREAASKSENAPASAPAAPSEQPPDAGTPADKESDATDTDEMLEWRPGQPLARKGLDVKHISPDFGVVTSLARPIPSVVVVHVAFNRKGWAVDSWIDPASKTGEPSIDGPVERAIASWTASGDEVNRLSKGETLVETVRMLF